jgi:hypothetical protein
MNDSDNFRPWVKNPQLTMREKLMLLAYLILFCAVVWFFIGGFEKLLFFLPEDWFTENSEGGGKKSDLIFTIGFFAACGILFWGHLIYEKFKKIKAENKNLNAEILRLKKGNRNLRKGNNRMKSKNEKLEEEALLKQEEEMLKEAGLN